MIFQIQTCCNVSKFIPVRVGGLENVSVEDNETTFDQLYQRIDKTVEFVGKAKPEDFKGKEDAEVVMKVGGGEIKVCRTSADSRKPCIDLATTVHWFTIPPEFRHAQLLLPRGKEAIRLASQVSAGFADTLIDDCVRYLAQGGCSSRKVGLPR